MYHIVTACGGDPSPSCEVVAIEVASGDDDVVSNLCGQWTFAASEYTLQEVKRMEMTAEAIDCTVDMYLLFVNYLYEC